MNPADEARVRDLLASARHDEGLPEDVAGRLDRTLADLNAERVTNPAIVPRDELAYRRRRRAGALLAAAAVIVVGGISVGQVLSPRGGESGVSEDAAGGRAGPTASEAESGEAETGDVDTGASPDPLRGQASSESAPGSAADSTARSSGTEAGPAQADRPVLLRSDTFATDVRRIAARVLPSPLAAVDTGRTSTCPGRGYGAGLLLAATYDGVPAVLAFRPPVGETRVAEVVSCGTGEVLRSVTLAQD